MTLLSLIACSGCQDPIAEAELPVETTRPDVVLVTLDTTRADRLGCYGYELADTPVLDALCSSGRRYDRAYSHIPLTIPSHASIFTGIYPAGLGIRDNGDARLEPSALTLTEILHEDGYQTVASVSAFVTTRTWGFDQGFDAYFDNISRDPAGGSIWRSERRAGEAVDDLLGWMEAERDPARPTFAWLHLYDPHFPYAPPDEYWETFKERPYDGELAYVDDQLQRVVDAFDKANTLFVLVADHGEGLGEHKELTHGLYVYDSTQHVPFILSGPGVEPGVVSEPVGLIDVMPSVLAALGRPTPVGLDGQAMPGNAPRPLYMESWALMHRFGFSPHLGLVDGNNKYIGVTNPELYDLLADPKETTGLEDPARITALAEALATFDYVRPEGSRVANDPAMAMQLEALGYMEGSFAGDLSGVLPDPKLHSDDILKSQQAEKAVRHNDHAGAEVMLRELAAAYPDALEFQSRLATSVAQQGRPDEAVVILEAALARAPHNASIEASLGVHYARQKRYAEATALFQDAAEQLPWAPGLRAMAVASQLSVPGGETKAVELGLGYLRTYPDDHAVAGLLGVAFAQRGVPEARQLLDSGIKAEKPEHDVAFLLGLVYLKEDNAKRAAELFELELKNYPRSLKASQALVTALDKLGDTEGVLRTASAGLLHSPTDLALLHAKAQALYNLKDYGTCRVELDLALLQYPQSSVLLLLDANLLAKEGKKEEGALRFEQATAAKSLEEAPPK